MTELTSEISTGIKARGVRTRTWLAVVLSGIFAVAGGLLIAHATRIAPYAYSDSTLFVETARSILEGGRVGTYGPSGSFTPLAISPPLYPFLLSLFGVFGVDLIEAARWLDVLLFAGFLLGIGLLSYRITRQLWVPLLLCSVSLLMPGLLLVYTGVMTEAVYHTLAVISLLLTVLYLQNQKRWVILLAALAAGLAFFSRYVGLAVPAAGFLALLVFDRTAVKRRLVTWFLYLFIAGLPSGGWVLGNMLSSDSLAGRSYGITNFAGDLQQLRGAFVDALWSWIPFIDRLDSPPTYRIRLILIAVALLIFIAGWLAGYRRMKNNPVRSEFLGPWVFAFYTVMYILVFSAAYLFNSPKPHLSERLLFPVYPGIIFTLIWFLYAVMRSIRKPLIPLALNAALVIVLIVSYLQPSLDYLKKMSTEGEGYTNLANQNSETVAVVRSLPDGLLVISNEFSLIHLLVDRPAYGMQELFKMQPLESFPRFGDDLTEEAQQKFRQEGAALVVFDSLRWQLNEFYGDRAEARMQAMVEGLYLYRDTADGAVYFYEKPAWVDEAQP